MNKNKMKQNYEFDEQEINLERPNKRYKSEIDDRTHSRYKSETEEINNNSYRKNDIDDIPIRPMKNM